MKSGLTGKRTLARIALVSIPAVTASFVALPTHAAEINVNLYGNGNTLATTDSAGVALVASGNWNNERGSPNWGSNSGVGSNPVSLNDSTTGTASGATAYAWTLAANGGATVSSGSDANYKMMSGYAVIANVTVPFSAGNNNANPSYFFVNSLPNAYTAASGSTYDVYVYFNASVSTLNQQFELYDGGTVTPGSNSPATAYTESGGTAYDIFAKNGNNLYSGTFVQATGTSTANATAGNYVEFTGLSQSNFTLITGSGGNGGDVTGFQIVSAPEPASYALLTVGGLGLLRRRRKHASA